eukprot:TRINITY_DN16649_c0_g1_i1.p1 TRINITY_DN16649_c0_g1~~TRINITY_DN16649_c0_g1_i1.p1  ORF type:complete len:267 (+),score=28.03 TRINITY_DN16649_c0_g1_i1:23-802(+)
MSYVIVDQSKNTRTCIYTPESEVLLPSEVSIECLDNAGLLYLDSRHTEAAKKVLEWALIKNIPVLLDAERDRPPHFEFILKNSDYICTNSSFPTQYTNNSDFLEAVIDLLLIGKAKFIATTLGANGCVLVERYDKNTCYSQISVLNSFEQLKSYYLHKKVSFSEYVDKAISHFEYQGKKCHVHVIHCSAYPFESNKIVDTTGAGDVFIGSIAFGLMKKFPIESILKLGSFVAGFKCTVSGGAQKGIPNWEQIPKALRGE